MLAAGITSTAQQLIEMAAGLQDHFDIAGLAGAILSAGIGRGLNMVSKQPHSPHFT